MAETVQNNYASKTTWINLYMTYGGTNWGNLAEPDDYTSCVTFASINPFVADVNSSRYDYAAPIREDHTLSPKYSEIKLQANFLHASPDFLVAKRIGNGTTTGGTAYSDNPRIYTTALRSDAGVNFYIIRQTSVK
jgi:Glycosyl hydrolases family 35